MDNIKIIIAYCIYLPITVALTYYVARVLFQNAKIFMLDIFKGREAIAEATNNLFRVGFYLINLGFALWFLEIASHEINSTQNTFEVLSYKIGGFAIYLGIMLFLHLYLFFRGKRKSATKQMPTNENLGEVGLA